MERLGQKFISTVAQGKIPEGGRVLRAFPARAAVELDGGKSGFESVQALDNGPQDNDLRPGHISIDYANSDDGAYRAHRYEATIEGDAQRGTVSELRHFLANGMAKAVTDASWTSLDGHSMTSVTYLQLDGRDKVEYASVNHVDTERPENSRAVGWVMGFDAAALDNAQDWQLLK